MDSCRHSFAEARRPEGQYFSCELLDGSNPSVLWSIMQPASITWEGQLSTTYQRPASQHTPVIYEKLWGFIYAIYNRFYLIN